MTIDTKKLRKKAVQAIARYEQAGTGDTVFTGSEVLQLLDTIDRLLFENEGLKIITNTNKKIVDRWCAELESAAGREAVANIRTWCKNGEQHDGIEQLLDGEHELYNSLEEKK